MPDYSGKFAKIINLDLGKVILEVGNQRVVIEPDYEMGGWDLDEINPCLSVTVKGLQDG